MSYLISYDLSTPGQDYPELHKAIEALGNSWHKLDSTWIVTHPGPAEKILDALEPYLDHNDRLLVVECSGEGAWTGFKEGGKWLKDNL